MLIILIILLLVFGFGGYRLGPGLGYYGGGGISLIILIVIILLAIESHLTTSPEAARRYSQAGCHPRTCPWLPAARAVRLKCKR